MIVIFACLVGISVCCLVYLFLDTTRGQGGIENRKFKERISLIKFGKQTPQSYLQQSQLSEISILDRLLRHNVAAKNVYQLLGFSKWNISVGAFFLMEVLIAYLGYSVLGRITRLTLGGVLGAAGFAFVPYWLLVINKRRYIDKFTVNFPDALLMIKNALKAGQGVQSGMQMVAEEGPAPVNREFSRMVQEIEMGNSLPQALSDLYKRLQTIDLRIFTLGIFIQQEVGGNLGELIEQIEKTIRERLTLSREIKVLSAQGKVSGLILMLLPVAVFSVLYVTNPTYFDPLLTTELGKRILTIAIVLQLIGCYLIRKITHFSITG